MKTNNLITTSQFKKTLVLSAALLVSSLSVQAADLVVEIDHINSDNGVVLAQVFSGKDNYKKGVAVDSQMLTAKTGSAQMTFKDLPAGEYAVRMFHDENNNQKMETNMFGMPTEGYGYSNEAVGNMGPAKYKKMAFTIAEEDTKVSTKVKMIY